MTEINKELLEHLAKLSRIELTPEEEERFVGDLRKILHHFEELNELGTDDVQPMTGGTLLKNSFRTDDERNLEVEIKDRENIRARFPEKEGEFLKVPPVFD